MPKTMSNMMVSQNPRVIKDRTKSPMYAILAIFVSMFSMAIVYISMK